MTTIYTVMIISETSEKVESQENRIGLNSKINGTRYTREETAVA